MKKRAVVKAIFSAPVVVTVVAALLLLGALCAPVRESATASWQVHSGEPVIRLHVRASGDSPAEQRFKMVLVERIRFLLSTKKALRSGDYATSLRLLQRSLPGLVRELQELADESAGGVPVAVHLSREQFPLRTYGRRILPAGEYTALIVTVGEGAGENWWCLLFPALCLPPAAAGAAEAGSAEPESGSAEVAAASGKGEKTSAAVRWRSKIWEALERSAEYVVEKAKQIFYN